jgi:folate-binding protein YgfZ
LEVEDMGGDDNCRMSAHHLPSLTTDGALRLNDWGLILAQGPEAAAFLNGQLTQDMLRLGDGRARLAGYCSPKGRLLATFVVWQMAPEVIALACSADLLAATLKRLSMYVLRAKCKLSDGSAQWPLYGLAGPSADALLQGALPAGDWAHGPHGPAQMVRLPAAGGMSRYLWAGAEAPQLPPLQADAWRWLEVQSGVPRIVAATADHFVPQMLNLELVGGVDFKKGCYPGQEVVARSQYRGTIKRRTYLVNSTVALAAGSEVFHSEDPGQPAGQVVLGASLGDTRFAALVELKMAALQNGTLHAGSADGPRLSVAALPYALDALAA